MIAGFCTLKVEGCLHGYWLCSALQQEVLSFAQPEMTRHCTSRSRRTSLKAETGAASSEAWTHACERTKGISVHSHACARHTHRHTYAHKPGLVHTRRQYCAPVDAQTSSELNH
eukprot:6179319-Pleurochrysis_carterae.AAC.1